MMIYIPTGRDFWKAVALFAYRRWVRPGDKMPVGIPGNRDPDTPCNSYEPVEWKTPMWNNCQTDGHYLCKECCHRMVRADDEEDGDCHDND